MPVGFCFDDVDELIEEMKKDAIDLARDLGFGLTFVEYEPSVWDYFIDWLSGRLKANNSCGWPI